MDETQLGRIPDFYNGRIIFLTGASGFLGRMALEKLLRACGDVQKIYILLRTKKDKNPEKRMDDLCDSIVFEKVQKINPDYRRKLTIIEGDISQPDLGIKPVALNMLIRDVDVIMHFAATVKFDENIKVATNINVRAVRDLMRMAKQMPQLKSFLHVSTAFSNCIHQKITENFYPVDIKGEALISMMDALNLETASLITPVLIGKCPNTYVFTKSVTENMIKKYGRDLPIGIVRPSIVLGSYREPVPGWIDNVYGPTGTMMGMALGFIRVMHTNLSLTAEIVPGDVVVNSSIAAIADIHQKFKTSSENNEKVIDYPDIPIYNVVSSTQSPMTWGNYKDLCKKHCLRIPSPKVIWHSIQIFTGNPIFYQIGIFFLHLIPAFLFDALLSCIGRKPLMVKSYNKLHHLISTVSYFATNAWTFENGNTQSLWKRLDPQDKKIFDFDMSNFDWDDYFHYYTLGGRLYLLSDPLDSIPEGRKKLKMLKIAHYALCACLIFFLYKICSWLLNLII